MDQVDIDSKRYETGLITNKQRKKKQTNKQTTEERVNSKGKILSKLKSKYSSTSTNRLKIDLEGTAQT